MQHSAMKHYSPEVVAGCTWFQNLKDNTDHQPLALWSNHFLMFNARIFCVSPHSSRVVQILCIFHFVCREHMLFLGEKDSVKLLERVKFFTYLIILSINSGST